MLKRLWLSGYRAWELSIRGEADPKLEVVKYLLKTQLTRLAADGLEWVITGGELGSEQWGAEVAITLKADFPQLQVAVMLPFEDFGQQWNETNQAQLHALQQRVDFTATTSKAPYTNPSQLTGYTRFMATHTDGALFLYDSDYPGKAQYAYAAALAEGARRDYPLLTLGVDDLEEAGRELAEDQEI